MENSVMVEKLKTAAGFISMFKGSTEGIDEVISELSKEEYHTPETVFQGDMEGAGSLIIKEDKPSIKS